MSREKNDARVYLPNETLAEMRREAKRLDRSLSWVAQRAWQHARRQLASVQGPHL